MASPQRKRPRRGHGEGSIFWREDRQRWIAELPLENGKSKTFTGKTYAEAQKKLNKAKLEQAQGKLATGPQQTVKQFLEHWLEDIRRPEIRVKSYITYRGYLDNHILPALGHVKLQQLTPQHIKEFYAQKLKEKYAAETVRGMHRLLHRAFKDAVAWSLMSYNICDKVDQPRRVKFKAQILTGEQAKKLLEVAKGTPWEALLTLALATGMRRGEILALRWSQVDLEIGRLEVSLTYCRVAKRFARDGIVENAPKTEAGNRMIHLPSFVLDSLRRHRERQASVRLKAGQSWVERDLVFTNAVGNHVLCVTLERNVKRLLERAELPDMRFHDLRHSTATLLLQMNIHPKQVQELLGHSNISITMDLYSHILPIMQKEMMDKLDMLFEKPHDNAHDEA